MGKFIQGNKKKGLFGITKVNDNPSNDDLRNIGPGNENYVAQNNESFVFNSYSNTDYQNNFNNQQNYDMNNQQNYDMNNQQNYDMNNQQNYDMNNQQNYVSQGIENNNYVENNINGYGYDQNASNDGTMMYNQQEQYVGEEVLFEENNSEQTNGGVETAPVAAEVFDNQADVQSPVMTMNNEMTEELETVEEVMDPLNNANNPVPVNPVAPIEESTTEEFNNVKANIFTVIGIFLGLIFKPGTTVVECSNKYKKTSKAVFISLWIMFVCVVLSIAANVVVGGFVRNYNSILDTYSVSFDPSRILNLNIYIEGIVLAIIISFVFVYIISILYYASSFFNSKGVRFGTYLTVTAVSMIPITLGIILFYPVGNVISPYLGIAFVIITLTYSLIEFISAINVVLTFSSMNKKIYYNVFNLSLMFIVVFIVLVILVRYSIIILPDLNI